MKKRFTDRALMNLRPASGKSLASLDMKDSTNAIKAVVNCAREHAREVAEAQTAPQEETTFSGTGFFVAPDLIVTNWHVVSGCRQGIYVRYPDQNSFAAGVVGQDSANDLALLRAGTSGLAVVAFRLAPRLGEAVATYGFPYHGILSSSGNFTLGNVTSMTGMGDDSRFLQMSTPIQPGNSGGPLLDMSGAVVGVVVAQLSAVNMMLAGSSVPQNVNAGVSDCRTIAIYEYTALDRVAQIAERKHCRPHARPFRLGFLRKVPVFPICPPAAL